MENMKEKLRHIEDSVRWSKIHLNVVAEEKRQDREEAIFEEVMVRIRAWFQDLLHLENVLIFNKAGYLK